MQQGTKFASAQNIKFTQGIKYLHHASVMIWRRNDPTEVDKATFTTTLVSEGLALRTCAWLKDQDTEVVGNIICSWNLNEDLSRS